MSLHAIIPAAGMGRRLGGHAGDDPKSLLELGGQAILARTVSTLAAHGVSRLTVVVGYRAERIQRCLAALETAPAIDYAWNRDYDRTEHGYSLFCARESWQRTRAPVLFMDADNVFEPALLQRLLADPRDDCVLVDPALDSDTRDEELVLGEHGRISAFVRGRARDFEHCVGGFVGMNRFSPGYMARLFAFMEELFRREGRGFKYERVFHRMLAQPGPAPGYLDAAGLAWVNVNHPADVARARALLGGGSDQDVTAPSSSGSRSSGSATA